MQKEIPILFSTSMVEANMEDRKTETRRMSGLHEINKDPDKWYLNPKKWPSLTGDTLYALFVNEEQDEEKIIRCPYGKDEDLLYVRETWLKYFRVDEDGYTHFDEVLFFYKADGEPDIEIRDADGALVDDQTHKWKPSIHMPKSASRLWLQNKDCQLERLQDITEEGAKAEGMTCGIFDQETLKFKVDAAGSYLNGFKYIWHLINGLKSWNLNPYVWVVKYKVISKTGKPNTI